MKLFQKRRDAIDSDVGSNHVFYGIEGHSFERDEFPLYVADDYANGENRLSKRPSNASEYGKSRQSIGGLVRKLNCAASKKHDYDLYQDLGERGEADDFGEVNSIASPNRSQHRPTAPLLGKQQPPKSDITRPVLITVKNGELNDQLQMYEDDYHNFYDDNELRSSYIVGELPPPSKMCTSTSFRLGISARKRYQNATKYFKHKDNEGGGWSGNILEDQEMERRRAAQEAARRERWKRGLEMENRMRKNPKAWARSPGRDNRYGDDSSCTDSLTQGSHTTGTSITGYDSSEDSSTVDDWTDASDESSPTRHHRHYRKYPYGAQCANGSQVVASVAEDFGIFAKLILSDGVACFGTAAELTKETVGNCKGKETAPPARPIERRSERRRWGRKHS